MIMQCDVLVGDVREGDQSLPAAPAGRLRGWRTDDVSNHRVQAIRTDQQIAFGRAAVFELDPHPVLRTDHPDRTGVASDAIGRKAFQQTFKQDSTWDHPNRSAQPVHDRGQVDSDERATSRCRRPARWTAADPPRPYRRPAAPEPSSHWTRWSPHRHRPAYPAAVRRR